MPLNDQPAILPNPWRVVLGTSAAVILPAVLGGLPGFELMEVGTLAAFGLLSVATMYLPLLRWLLPKTRQRLLACIILGAVAAPGPVGYAMALGGMLFTEAGATAAALILLVTAPFGLLGGFIFWLCAMWRIEEVRPAKT